MENFNKRNYDMASISEEINKRLQIIDLFEKTGYLDRSNALNMIKELRQKDIRVNVLTVPKINMPSVLLSDLNDKGLINELINQLKVLCAELFELNNQ